MTTQTKLNKLTPEQEALMLVVREEWVQHCIGGDTAMERPAVEAYVHRLYDLAKLPRPKYIILMDSPMACQLAVALLRELKCDPADLVRSGVWSGVRNGVESGVRSGVRNGVESGVRSGVRNGVESGVWNGVRNGVRSGVWSGVWNGVRNGVESGVESGVWNGVWSGVRNGVWSGVWNGVESGVRSGVESEIQVSYESFSWEGFGWNSAWVAFYDYFTRIGVINSQAFNEYRQMLWDSGIWDCILLTGVAIVSCRPKSVLKDDRSRMHCTTGPAIQFVDGYCQYWVHGIHFQDGTPIEQPSTITVERVLGEQNAEVRRTLVNLMGSQRFATESNPQILDQDVDRAQQPRRLLRIDLPGDEPVTLVHVRCPSTGHEHYIRVAPSITTCAEAVAQSWGLSVSQYHPIIEK